jgi:hypothetical protein
MGGSVRVVLVEDNKVQSFVTWTNSITHILKSTAFINGDLSELYKSIEYFKSRQLDYSQNKETRNYLHSDTQFYGLYDDSITPVEYGIIYIDTINKKILYSFQYSNLKTLNFSFGLYRNGLLVLTSTDLDSKMKTKSLSHFEIYDEKAEGFNKIEINQESTTLIDLITQVKENIDLESLDYTELGMAAHVRATVYFKTPYDIQSYKEPKDMIESLIKLGINLSEKEVESFNSEDE